MPPEAAQLALPARVLLRGEAAQRSKHARHAPHDGGLRDEERGAAVVEPRRIRQRGERGLPAAPRHDEEGEGARGAAERHRLGDLARGGEITRRDEEELVRRGKGEEGAARQRARGEAHCGA